jgi:hypothetical protein
MSLDCRVDNGVTEPTPCETVAVTRCEVCEVSVSADLGKRGFDGAREVPAIGDRLRSTRGLVTFMGIDGECDGCDVVLIFAVADGMTTFSRT